MHQSVLCKGACFILNCPTSWGGLRWSQVSWIACLWKDCHWHHACLIGLTSLKFTHELFPQLVKCQHCIHMVKALLEYGSYCGWYNFRLNEALLATWYCSWYPPQLIVSCRTRKWHKLRKNWCDAILKLPGRNPMINMGICWWTFGRPCTMRTRMTRSTKFRVCVPLTYLELCDIAQWPYSNPLNRINPDGATFGNEEKNRCRYRDLVMKCADVYPDVRGTRWWSDLMDTLTDKWRKDCTLTSLVASLCV